jgi:serine/threonine protein kinase
LRERALALCALRDVVLALAALHAQGWVHRDVRWPNILQVDSGAFMLIDFEYAARIGTKVLATCHQGKRAPQTPRKWGGSRNTACGRLAGS